MKRYIVFDAATGAVKRWGTCADRDYAFQAKQGEGVIPWNGEHPRRVRVDVSRSPPALVPIEPVA